MEIDRSAIKYRVTLTDNDVEILEALLRKGKSAARRQTRARILLKAAAGWKDAAIMEALAISATMVGHTRQRCVEEGVEAARQDRPRPGKVPKRSDKPCAHMRRRGTIIGRCDCWPTRGCSWARPTRSAMKLFAGS